MSAGRKHRHITAAELKCAARGLWVQILADAGIPESSLTGRGCPSRDAAGMIVLLRFQMSMSEDRCTADTASTVAQRLSRATVYRPFSGY